MSDNAKEMNEQNTNTNAAANANIAPIWILLACLMIYAVLGCFVDALPLIVLLTPIFLPIVRDLDLGFGGNTESVTIWFGVLMVMLMQLGLMTPPVGMCCYVMSGVAPDTPLTKIFKGTAPFLIGIAVAIAIVILFPAITTFLPSLMVSGG